MGESWISVAESLPAYRSASSDITRRIDAYATSPTLGPNADLFDVYGAESTADQEAASTPLKPWLIKAFDRDYFKQVCHMYYTSRSNILPSESGSQTSFGNMSFSSAIYANHHPESIQETQQHNYHVPIWAQRVLHVTMMQVDPFHEIMTELRKHIAGGISVEDVCGPHAYFADGRRRHVPSSTHAVTDRRAHSH